MVWRETGAVQNARPSRCCQRRLPGGGRSGEVDRAATFGRADDAWTKGGGKDTVAISDFSSREVPDMCDLIGERMLCDQTRGEV